MMKVNSDTLLDNDHFFQYIKGISIKGTAGNQAVYSFNCTDSTLFLRLYYHYTNPDPQVAYVDSKYLADNLQFNHVATNRTGTALQALTPFTGQRISSQLTGNKSYIQNAGGLQLRIDLPYLRNFKTESTYRKILKAELYIRPYNYSSASIYKLPSSFTLLTATNDNYPGAYILDKNTGQQQTVAPVIDNLYGTDTYYLFNISNYVTDIIDGATENYEGLFLQAPAYLTNNAIDRLILAQSALYKSVEIRIYRLSL